MTDYNKQINKLFDEIKNHLAPFPKSRQPYDEVMYGLDRLMLNNIVSRKGVILPINFLEASLHEYQQKLLNETDPQRQEVALKAAEKLKEAIVTILDETKDNFEKQVAISDFDKQARASNFSEGERVLIGCIVGCLIGLVFAFGTPIGIATLILITGALIGGMIASNNTEHSRSKANSKEILSDIKLLAFEREKWILNGTPKATNMQLNEEQDQVDNINPTTASATF